MYLTSISVSCTSEVNKKWLAGMNVIFSTAALATLCNSERQLSKRWGPDIGRTIARRLLDLAAAEAATLDRLPGVVVSTNRSGETAMTFGDEIVVHGFIGSLVDGDRATPTDADDIVITSLHVRGSNQR